MSTATEIMARRLSVEGQVRNHRAYLQAVQPIIVQKVRILCLCMPAYWLHPDGRMEKKDDGLTPELQACMESLDEMHRQVAESFGFQLPALTTRAQAAMKGIAP